MGQTQILAAAQRVIEGAGGIALMLTVVMLAADVVTRVLGIPIVSLELSRAAASNAHSAPREKKADVTVRDDDADDEDGRAA